MNRLLGLYIMLLFGFGSSPAWASDVQRAVKMYQSGFSAYSQNQFKQAVVRFKQARKLLPLLGRYNKTRAELDRLIGFSYYKLGQDNKAFILLNQYRRSPYLQKSKIPEVNRILLLLRKRMGLDQPAVRRVKKIPPRRVRKRRVVVLRRRPAPPRMSRKVKGFRPHPVAWATVGLGVLTVGAAVVVGVMAQQNMDGANTKYLELQNEASRNAGSISVVAREALMQSTVANALYIGGGVLTATGVVLLFTWHSAPTAAQ